MSIHNEIIPFGKLCYGAHFRYPGQSSSFAYVKIGHNTIAQWDPNQQATGWVGQGIYSLTDNDEDAAGFVVEFIWRPSS